MTKEDKQLLLQDLCARLPYGVRVKSGRKRKPVTLSLDAITDFYLGCSIKPYLRPMSSMTEEEKIDYQSFFNYDGVEYPNEYIDWLNKNMFDYRGLIEKGLAIEASEGMYNLKVR